MIRYFMKLSLIFLSIFSFSVSAALLNKDAIPEKVISQLMKRHPKAEEIQGEQKVHFAQSLYKVSFKDGEDKLIELYRPDGHFFAGSEKIESIYLMVPGSEQNLKAAFNDYEVKESTLVVNPNGAGEEYDLLITSGGKNWSVIVDGKGNVIKKVQD